MAPESKGTLGFLSRLPCHFRRRCQTDPANATRRTRTYDANNTAATPKVDTVSSSSKGPWQTVGAAVQLGNDPALDALPPPYGC